MKEMTTTMESMCNRLRFFKRCKGKPNCPADVDEKIKEIEDGIIEMTLEMYPEKLDKLATYEDAEEQGLPLGWIPIDEKLPDVDEYIIVSFENFTVPMIGRYTVDDDDNGTFRATKIKLKESLEIAKSVDEAKSKGRNEISTSLYYDGYNDGYSKALDDLLNSLPDCDYVEIERLVCLVEQLKKGGENGN